MKLSNIGRPRRPRGFTLIELMITVAIVAILASIAYPSYQQSVLKGRRAQARAAIVELMQQQERYMTQNNRYFGFDNATTNVPFKRFSGDNADNAAYDLSATACSNTLTLSDCVLITATPRRAGSDNAAGNLTMTSTGVKDCTGSNKSVCWP
ncbi:prepilin-type N-terminal cleavage/methylation domain-containing protein [Xylophilus sp. Kf1]|nr:prepilin-type N-terminal cleavage/methylation domain-containing protein [Xylophilus sp. Kf1]